MFQIVKVCKRRWKVESFKVKINAHSKWLEIKMMNSITSADVIIELKEKFSYHGLGDQIFSDNGPSLTSQEFSNFVLPMVLNIIITTYRPVANDLAERAVGIFKSAMIKLGSKFSLS